MDIKLRARLSAYTKIESLAGLNSNVPDPDATAAGNVLGVNDLGKYTLFPSIGREDVDTLFADVVGDTTVTKDDINDLFTESSTTVSVTKIEIDSLFQDAEKIESVDKQTIDTLFGDSTSTEAVDKETIDTLFAPTSDEDKISTVTFAEIDSLFK